MNWVRNVIVYVVYLKLLKQGLVVVPFALIIDIFYMADSRFLNYCSKCCLLSVCRVIHE